jgi:hypothetical protein
MPLRRLSRAGWVVGARGSDDQLVGENWNNGSS